MNLIPLKFRQDYELMYRKPLVKKDFVTHVLLRGSVLMMYLGRLSERSGAVGRLARFLYLLSSRRRGIELNYAFLQGGGGYHLCPCLHDNRQ